MNSDLDVVVIGAGQAGLAIGYHLARQGVRFAILDAAPGIGHSWRTRWHSLTLFTPAQYSSLPGLPFPAARDHYPGKDEVADYLDAYARTFSLPVWLDEPVLSLTRDEAGHFGIRTAYATYTAAQVVVATGPFQKPFIPALGGEIAPEAVQIHSSRYRNPAELPEGDVLVVGAGNSGVQIAAELARSRRTWLSLGERVPRLPERVLGRSLFWWLEQLGAMNVTAKSRMGRHMSGKDLLIGQSPAMIARGYGVHLMGRTSAAEGSVVRTADGQQIEPAAIVWATGYRPDFRWIELPVFGDHGRPRHLRGVTSPGAVFPRPLLAAHARLRADRLGRSRRGVPGGADRRAATNAFRCPQRRPGSYSRGRGLTFEVCDARTGSIPSTGTVCECRCRWMAPSRRSVLSRRMRGSNTVLELAAGQREH